MRLAILILLLSAASLAIAEPVSIWIAGTGLVFTGTQVLTFAFTVGMAVYGAAQQKKAEKKAARAAEQQRNEYNASLKDRMITSVATESPYTYVYGRARVGSSIVGIFASGGRDEYKHLVCVHAAHESDAFEEVYINGVALGALDGDGFVTSGIYYNQTTENVQQTTTGESITLSNTPIGGTLQVLITTSTDGYTDPSRPLPFEVSAGVVTFSNPDGYRVDATYQYTLGHPMVRVRKHLGTPDDPADASLLAEVPGLWAPTAVLRGFTYTVVRLNLNQAEFQGGVPNIEVLLRGKKLYDFRSETTAWSDNPVLATYDYLTSEICGVAPEDIPLSKFIAAANACDEEINVGKRYTLNGTITSNQAQAQILEQFAQAMAGTIVSTNWNVRAGKYVAPVMALEQEDIVGALAITPGMPDTDTYNGVKGQFIAPVNEYVATDYAPYQNPNFLTFDGREIWTDIDFPYTNTLQRVHNLSRIFTERNRNAFSVKAELSLKTWALEVGDRITFTSEYFGWAEKVFEITDKRFSPTSAVELTIKEDAASIWDEADQTTDDATPNTNLPNPFFVENIASLTAQSGTDQLLAQDGTVISRILLTWPASQNSAVFTKGFIEIEWQMVGSDVWQQMQAAGDETQAYLSPVQDGSFYNIRVRAVNPYLNVKSDWTYAPLHQVIGKTAPPADVATFFVTNGIFSWPPNTELDLAGYVVRFQYGNNTSWADAAPMHTGILVSSPWTPEIFPPGPITVMIKAVDTSGNESLNPAIIQYNFGDTILENLIFSYDDKAAGFAGEATNGSVVGGNLVADDSGDLFWGADLARFWGTDSLEFWPTSTYKEMTYLLAYEVSPDEANSRLTLDITVVASSYTIEYRYGTQGFFWGDDADFFWGSDEVLFWPAATEWSTWPGAIENVQPGIIEFRVVTQAGETQGQITEFTLNFDVVDEYEELDNIFVSALGTRLPIVKLYRSINNIQLTLQEDGGTAVTAKWIDKLNTGPLIGVYDTDGNPTTGTIDARIQGVKGGT